jgi:hypothetical protein
MGSLFTRSHFFTMARSKSKHRRVQHRIKLRWKKRLARKKDAQAAAATKAPKRK